MAEPTDHSKRQGADASPVDQHVTISDIVNTLHASALQFEVDPATGHPSAGERGEPDDVEIFREGEIIPNFTFLQSSQPGPYSESSTQEVQHVEPRPTGNFSLSLSEQAVEIRSPRKLLARIPDRSQSYGLCELCKSIDFWSLKEGVQHRSCGDLQQHADKCDFCAVLFDSVLEPESFISNPDKPVMLHGTCDYGSENVSKLEVRYPSIESGRVASVSENSDVRCTELDVFVENSNPYQYYFSGRSVNSADDPAQVNRWLHDCMTSHQACGEDAFRRGIPPASETPVLPKRVICVASNGKDIEPFLFESAGKRAQYLSLSHRWGNSGIQKTTVANLEERRRGIRLDSLCKTFQDAIFITHKLGFEYIWIDALCIIQDSLPDWREQASNMADIYRSSTITFSAAIANSGDSGLLYPRDKPRTVELPLRVPNSQAYPSLTYSVSTRHLSSFEDDVVGGTLSKRAWCLQEQILPLRVVYFGHDQLHWDCLTKSLSESSTTAIKEGGIAHDMRKTFAASDANWRHQHDLLLKNKLPEDGWLRQAYGRGHYGTWYRMVADCSNREITKDTDRLPALGGLAQAWAKRTGENYACGLWNEDLAAGFLWCGSSFHEPYGTRSHLRRPPERTAPSWSWLSFDGPVQYPLGKLGPIDIERPWFVGAADQASLSSIGSPGPAFIRITGRIRTTVTMQSFSQPVLAQLAQSHQHMIPDKIPRIAFDEDGKYDFTQMWCLLIAFRGCGSKICNHAAGCKLGFAYAVVLWPNVETGCCKRVGVAQTFQSDWEGVARDTVTLEKYKMHFSDKFCMTFKFSYPYRDDLASESESLIPSALLSIQM